MAQKTIFQEVLEYAAHDIGAEVYAYSGRAMYGARCVAVNAESVAVVMRALFGAVGDHEDPAEAAVACADACEYLQVDSMGRDVVVYFARERFVSDQEVLETGSDGTLEAIAAEMGCTAPEEA